VKELRRQSEEKGTPVVGSRYQRLIKTQQTEKDYCVPSEFQTELIHELLLLLTIAICIRLQ
jgi:hypothetical protein